MAENSSFSRPPNGVQDTHTLWLASVCRICCEKEEYNFYPKLTFKEEFTSFFFVDVEQEDKQIYPPGVCHKHARLLNKFRWFREHGCSYSTTLPMWKFQRHTESNCLCAEKSQNLDHVYASAENKTADVENCTVYNVEITGKCANILQPHSSNLKEIPVTVRLSKREVELQQNQSTNQDVLENRELDRHTHWLSSVCRICCQSREKNHYSKLNFREEFALVFNADVENEDGQIFPPRMCRRHAKLMYRVRKRLKQGLGYSGVQPLFLFQRHMESNCCCVSTEKSSDKDHDYAVTAESKKAEKNIAYDVDIPSPYEDTLNRLRDRTQSSDWKGNGIVKIVTPISVPGMRYKIKTVSPSGLTRETLVRTRDVHGRWYNRAVDTRDRNGVAYYIPAGQQDRNHKPQIESSVSLNDQMYFEQQTLSTYSAIDGDDTLGKIESIFNGEVQLEEQTGFSLFNGELQPEQQTESLIFDGEVQLEEQAESSIFDGEVKLEPQTESSIFNAELQPEQQTERSTFDGKVKLESQMESSIFDGELHPEPQTESAIFQQVVNVGPQMVPYSMHINRPENLEPQTVSYFPYRAPKLDTETESSVFGGEVKLEPQTESSIFDGEVKLEPQTESSIFDGEVKLEPQTESSIFDGEVKLEPLTESCIFDGEVKLEPQTESSIFDGEVKLEPQTESSIFGGEIKLEPQTESSLFDGEVKLEPQTEPSVFNQEVKLEPLAEFSLFGKNVNSNPQTASSIFVEEGQLETQTESYLADGEEVEMRPKIVCSAHVKNGEINFKTYLTRKRVSYEMYLRKGGVEIEPKTVKVVTPMQIKE